MKRCLCLSSWEQIDIVSFVVVGQVNLQQVIHITLSRYRIFTSSGSKGCYQLQQQWLDSKRYRTMSSKKRNDRTKYTMVPFYYLEITIRKKSNIRIKFIRGNNSWKGI